MKHLILIGFKNAGKSTIGLALAKRLKRTFIDLDEKIIEQHQKNTGEKLSCREIMKNHGEKFFRTIEHQVLKNIITSKDPLILALGGGTPMREENRKLLANHQIILVDAPKSIVFERIMINGKPAFFPKEQNAFDSFQQLWNEREPIFRQLANITVQNSGSVEKALEEVIEKLSIK